MKILYVIVACAILFASCTNNSQNEIQEVDSHENVNLQITSYNDKFEIYAEATPFVIGVKSNILSHFTHIPSFKALENGKVKVRLIIGDKEISQTLDKPTRKGIYSFNITPKVVGKGLIIFEIGEDKSKLIISNIEVFGDEHNAVHTAEAQNLSSSNGVVYTKEQSWKADFATEVPQLQNMGTIIKTVGQIQPTQTDEIILTAKTNGIINYSENSLLLGTSVSNNQILFSVVSDGFSENNATVLYLESKNNLEKYKADYERLKKLDADKIISKKQLLEAKNNYSNAKVKFENYSKEFNDKGMIIKSEVNGFIRNVFVKNGTYVQSGQKIATIVKNQTLLLKTEVQQKNASIINSIYSANIKFIEDDRVYTLEELDGKIASIGKSVDKNNYMIPVTLQFNNNGKFLPGSIVQVFLKTKNNTQAYSLPNTALLEDQGRYFVYKQITPELFEKQEVKLGLSDGLRTEILGGINAEMRVVSRGAILVKLAQATGNLDPHSGHSH